jgi:hypothetical protein
MAIEGKEIYIICGHFSGIFWNEFWKERKPSE